MNLLYNDNNSLIKFFSQYVNLSNSGGNSPIDMGCLSPVCPQWACESTKYLLVDHDTLLSSASMWIHQIIMITFLWILFVFSWNANIISLATIC